MARRVQASNVNATPPVAPVVTRHILDELSPALRPLALELSRDGSPDGRPDPARIVVLSRGSFEVAPPRR